MGSVGDHNKTAEHLSDVKSAMNVISFVRVSALAEGEVRVVVTVFCLQIESRLQRRANLKRNRATSPAPQSTRLESYVTVGLLDTHSRIHC
jgi:hypothetical protein